MGAGRAVENKRGDQVNPWSLLGIGGYNALCLVAGMGLGWYLDHRWHTLPIFVLLGLLAGIVLAVFGTWTQIRKFL